MNNLGQRWNGSFGRRAFLIRMCLLVIAGVSISQSVFSQDEKCQPRGEGRLIYVKRFNAEGKVLSLKEYNPQGISFSRIKQVQTDDGNLLMGCDKISGYWYKLLEENKMNIVRGLVTGLCFRILPHRISNFLHCLGMTNM